jgi:hypothetical protein
MDYDLYLYTSCGSGPVASSTLGAGQVDEATYAWDDSLGERWIYIKVRYHSGAANFCNYWTLQIWGGCPQ